MPQRLAFECGCGVREKRDGLELAIRCDSHQRSHTTLVSFVRHIRPGKRVFLWFGNKGTYAPHDAPATPAPTSAGFTYNANLTGNPADYVRFMLGDTNAAKPALLDGEIAGLLALNGNDALSAAIAGCDAIIARLSPARDESVGSVSISFSQQAGAYVKLAAVLRRQAAKRGRPYAGGISRSDKRVQRSDGDRVRPSFTRDMMQRPDNPEETLYAPGFDNAGFDEGGYGYWDEEPEPTSGAVPSPAPAPSPAPSPSPSPSPTTGPSNGTPPTSAEEPDMAIISMGYWGASNYNQANEQADVEFILNNGDVNVPSTRFWVPTVAGSIIGVSAQTTAPTQTNTTVHVYKNGISAYSGVLLPNNGSAVGTLVIPENTVTVVKGDSIKLSWSSDSAGFGIFGTMDLTFQPSA